MTGKAYRARIAASKAALDEDVRALAAENVGMERDEFVALARERLHCALDTDYAEEVLDDAAACAAARRR